MDIWQYFIDYCSILTFTGWVTKLFLSSPAHSHLFPAMLLNFLPVSWGDGFIPPNTHLICGITREYSSTLPSIEQLRRNKNLLCFLLVPTNSRIPLLRRDSGQRERENIIFGYNFLVIFHGEIYSNTQIDLFAQTLHNFVQEKFQQIEPRKFLPSKNCVNRIYCLFHFYTWERV